MKYASSMVGFFVSFAIEVCMSPKARTPMFQKTETVQEIRMAYGN